MKILTKIGKLPHVQKETDKIIEAKIATHAAEKENSL